ncbi:MAG: hypothetical protein KAV18_01455, partial [Candidatus Omnitrophica bacterium]|nr:hypothetical protein [Candidatus Omnitrophota bacterium]
MVKSKNKIFYQLNIIGRKYSWLIIILSAVLVYSNTFFSPFTYDDKAEIIDNLSMRNIINLRAIASHDPTHLIT